MRSQRRVSELEAELLTVRAQLANSQIKFVGKTKVRGSKKTPSAIELEIPEEEREAGELLWTAIKKIAKHFQLFGSPFFDADLLSVAPPDFSSTDPIRYADADNQLLGKTAELYEFVPKKYHYLMSVAQTHRADSKSFVQAVKWILF